jgi:D-psicose/D-tagatose/L-ribulose 3-epimerase
MNKVGIYFAYWTRDWKADFTSYVKKVSSLGFDVLELATAHLLDMSQTELDVLRMTADEANIELTYCVGFSKDKDMASEDSTIRKNGIEYAKKTLEKIHYLKGKVFGGINYSAWPGTINECIIDKRPYLERSIQSIKEVIKTAEEYDITYCIEVVNRFEQFLINTAAEGVAYVEEVGSPNLKLLLDIFHMNIEEDFIGEAIILAGDKLGHLHIGECNRKTPGRGHMPWDEIMQALNKINYQGRIVMEPFTKMGGEVGRDIKVWRDLSDNADEEQMDAAAKAALEFIRGKVN